MIVLSMIFIGVVIGFFMNQLMPTGMVKMHIDIIMAAFGAPLGFVISSPFTGPNDVASKAYSLLIGIIVAVMAVFVGRIAKL